MTLVANKNEIKEVLSGIPVQDLIASQEEGFISYSKNEVVVPPVGSLKFQDPPGDVHIKYGYRLDDAYYVIKIASGFYDNPRLGIASSNGCMLIFSQDTGELQGILLDEGYLTDVRTAVTGAMAAKHLAPSKISAIGIVGTGIQARMQLEYLSHSQDFDHVIVWGRNLENLAAYSLDMLFLGKRITTTQDMDELCAKCNLIFTTTASTTPLLQVEQVRPGTHITAMGSDTPGKQELDENLVAKADIIVADSYSQCAEYGEISHALNAGLIDKERVVEIGTMLANGEGRDNDQQITIADQTGVAIQDIQIAKMVYLALE